MISFDSGFFFKTSSDNRVLLFVLLISYHNNATIDTIKKQTSKEPISIEKNYAIPLVFALIESRNLRELLNQSDSRQKLK